MTRHLVLVSIVLLLCGCASTPDVLYSYYPPCSKSNVTVTQTLDCNSDKSALIVVNSTTVNTLTAADHSKGPYTVRIKKLDGVFADSDVAVAFFDDGRLKSINATTTGQAEAALKSAISLAAALVPIGGGERAPVEKPTSLCSAINSLGGGKPVTLIYTKNIDYGTVNFGQARFLDPAPDSVSLYTALNSTQPELVPKPQVIVDTPVRIKGGAYGSASEGDVSLTLQETATAKVTVKVSGQNIWSGDITIPGNNSYSLPIPKAPLFGKQNFTLTLSEIGAITQIEYGKTTGAAALLNVANAAETAALPGTTAEKAGEIRAQADLIAQQQRLARCKADPAHCQ